MSNWNVNLTGVIVATGPAVPMMKWEGNKPTDTPQTNAEGVPLYKIPLLYKPEGAADYEKISVEVPSAKTPEAIPDFTPVQVTGAKLRVNTWTDGNGKTRLSEKLSATSVKRA